MFANPQSWLARLRDSFSGEALRNRVSDQRQVISDNNVEIERLRQCLELERGRADRAEAKLTAANRPTKKNAKRRKR